MNALSLTASAAGIFIISTIPSFAQSIRALFGVLNMETSIFEAESALKTKSYLTKHGNIILMAKFNDRDYYITFSCHNGISSCDREAMRPAFIRVVYNNDVSFDIRPRKVKEILEDFGFGDVKARYDTNCAYWTTKMSTINVGRVCGSWGIRMRNRQIVGGYNVPRLGGFTPCTAECF
ncbi:hypothetical protein [Methylobacterium sp. J-068]|uniref:hypothetical protein n=1 Tax=Methylobacterium sp. J-068 TaxID=2836649 RepID=UPI001FB88909|nr:hypothetical protein [Methylobacterium sp. J-068]MCJ2034054.1 hypothetical protein [Methylobacterium sp. J-068]